MKRKGKEWKEKTAKTIGTVYIYIYIYPYFYKRTAGQSGERYTLANQSAVWFCKLVYSSNFIGNKEGCNAFSLDIKNKLLAMCNVNMAD